MIHHKYPKIGRRRVSFHLRPIDLQAQLPDTESKPQERSDEISSTGKDRDGPRAKRCDEEEKVERKKKEESKKIIITNEQIFKEREREREKKRIRLSNTCLFSVDHLRTFA